MSDHLKYFTGCGGCVAQRSHHEAVCLRRHRWIGSPSSPALDNSTCVWHRIWSKLLDTTPDCPATQVQSCCGSVHLGVTMVDDWQRRGVLPDLRDRARLLFRVEPDIMLSTAPHVQAAHYPSVRLTRLIMTPGWLRGATSGPAGWNHAASQTADQITSGYRRSTANHDAFALTARR